VIFWKSKAISMVHLHIHEHGISNVYYKAPAIDKIAIHALSCLCASRMSHLITSIHFIFLKWTSDADLNPNEAEVSKQYPAHTAICIRDGWEFCSPELAAGMIY